MNIFKRFKNLWKLSEIEPKKGEISLEQFKSAVDSVSKHQMAQIIKLRKDQVEEALNS